MTNNVISFPENNPSKVTSSGQITTIAELRNELKLIDLTKVGIFESHYGREDEIKEMKKVKENIHRNYFNIKYNKRLNKEVLSLGIKDCSSEFSRRYHLADEIIPYKDLIEGFSTYSVGSLLKVYKISGGTLEGKINPLFKSDWGRDHFKPSFTKTLIITDRTDKIIGVHYDYDMRSEWKDGERVKSENTYVRNWLRSKIDRSIKNNWEQLFSIKTFYLPVATTTYEIKEVSAKTFEDAIKELKNEYAQFKLLEEFEKKVGHERNYRDKSKLYNLISSFSGIVELPNVWRKKEIDGFLSPDTYKNKTNTLKDVIRLAKEELKKNEGVA